MQSSILSSKFTDSLIEGSLKLWISGKLYGAYEY